ncbi:PQQ-dependent sugar dehydrogenase [Tautonia rosea]|uniref:PQQ-dependent sugar dehydrogenase n=1 Tax=Tautonia rosea TaxID=2728037 RepID=UPI0014734466|nr:PQQ-dependent sugar dehydrogenase [Tautonia rosea]
MSVTMSVRSGWFLRVFLCPLLFFTASLNVAADDDEGRFGLSERVPWHDSRVVGSPEPPLPYRTEPAFPKLEIFQPLTFDAEPGRDAYLIIQHHGSWSAPGTILRIPNDPEASDPQVVLELPGIAYELAFHPDYEQNGYLFVGQNVSNGEEPVTRVSRFTVDREAPYAIDPASEVVIIDWPSNGHNGGAVDFGGDGMLYITSGDGTGDSDTNLRGQDLSELTSKVLRIDVDHPAPGQNYAVPPDNPFVDRPGARPETWAYGLRNPWRMTYDKTLDQLWVGNNGQDLWEQAYLVTRGANYGWSAYEGGHPFFLDRMGPDPLTPPTVEHHHSEARSLTGGVVYHGQRLPELRGAYVYGDFSTGKIWGVKHDGQQVTWHQEIADTPFALSGFGLDKDGELIVIDHLTGFYRMVPQADDRPAAPFPTLLSETGLYRSVADRQTHEALIPYAVNSPLWSDGSIKQRFIAIPGDPDEAKVSLRGTGQGWDFPEGTVLVKEFALEFEAGNPASRQPIETRLMTRQQGEWVGYSYLWNDDRTDAVLVSKEGADRTYTLRDPEAPGGIRTLEWHYPSRAECMVCHSRAANYVLGLSTEQMNRTLDYGNGRVANQLATLEHIGLFKEPLPNRPEALPKLVDPSDETAPIEARARSYLHANCASCHVEAGGGNAAINLRFDAPLDRLRLVDEAPTQGDLGIANARLVAPGDPERSVLYHRITRRGPNQMPPLATTRIDPDAEALVRAWIEQLNAPNSLSSGAE